MSDALAQELNRAARQLTGAIGRKARAAGALAALAAPIGGVTPEALAQTGYGPPPAPAPGVVQFQPGPNPGYADPRQPFTEPNGQNPLFATPNVPFNVRGRVESNIGDGRGYEDGYTRGSAFFPWVTLDGNSLFFLDAGGFGSYDRGAGLNVGFGARRYLAGLNRIVGANAWFDLDSNFDNDVADSLDTDVSFTRFGLGLESIGELVTVRGNAYIPLNDSEVLFNSLSAPAFVGKNIALTETTVERLSYGGVEGEIGGPLPVLGTYGASGFVGAYVLAHDDANNVVGVSSRLDLRASEAVNVGAQLTSDDVFGTNVWLNFTLATPQGSWYDFMRTGWFQQPEVYNRMDDAVVRQHRAMTKDQLTRLQENLQNADGTDIMVCHIDPTAAGGDGSVENPYGSFSPLLSGNNCLDDNCDIVRVIASPGATTLVTDGPINLAANQQLLSSAERQFISAQFRGASARYELPGFTGGTRPTLQNGMTTPSYVIGLNDNNVVSGFTISGLGGNGLPIHDGIISVGDCEDLPADFNTLASHEAITSFNINRNTFLSVRDGVDIEHVGNGRGVFTGNTLTGNGVAGLGPGAPGFNISGAGFDVEAQGGSLTLIATENTITNFFGEDVNRDGVVGVGEDFAFPLTPTEGAGEVNEGFGIRVAALNGSTVNSLLADNTVTNNETGVSIEADGSTQVATLRGNTVSDNGGRTAGVQMLADSGANLTATLSDNTVQNNGLAPTAANLLRNNSFTPDLGSQILAQVDGDLTGTGGSTLSLNLQDNTISSTTAGSDMVLVEADGTVGTSSTVNFLAQGNDLTGRAPQLANVTGGVATSPYPERIGGMILDVQNATLNAQIGGLADGDGNTVTQAAGAGIAVLAAGGPATNVNLRIESNVVSDTAFDEVNIPITSVGGGGPTVPGQTGNSVLAADFDNVFVAQNNTNQLTPYQGDGIYVRVGGQANMNGAVINRNVVTGATPAGALGLGNLPGDGIQVTAAGSAVVTNLLIGDPGPPGGNGNVVTGNASGILVRRQDSATMDGTRIIDNVALGNAVAGLTLQGLGDATDEFDVTVANNNLSSNNRLITGVGFDDRAGLRVESGSNNVTRLNVVNNQIRSNGSDGILLTNSAIDGTLLRNPLTDVGTIVGSIANNDVANNASYGLHSVAVTGTLGLGGFDRAEALAANELFVEQNAIVGSGLAGVLLQGAGTMRFEDNLIAGNGSALPAGSGAGIDIEGNYFGLNFNRDIVQGNFGDGVEMVFNDPIFSYVRFTDLKVLDNADRGYDILNQGNAYSLVDISGTTTPSLADPTAGSVISGNGGEATYIVNTASTTQTQTGPTPEPSGLSVAALQDGNEDHGLERDGAFQGTAPRLKLLYENNLVTNNGQAGTFDSNGLVIRVGTSDGGGGTGDTGGFASNVYTATAGTPPGTSGDVFFDNFDLGRGGVAAIVQSNTFAANAGTQVLFEGFTSTVDPPNTTFGTGGEPTGPITSYESDPKSRLDLVFNDNVLTSNSGIVLDGADTVGAWYDNADPAKSRPFDNDNNGATPFTPGQFPNNVDRTRRRNAQRQDIPPGAVATNGVDNSAFAYPLVGFGESTFRVNSADPGLVSPVTGELLVPGLNGSGTNTINGGAVTNDFAFGLISNSIRVGTVPGEDGVQGGSSDFVWNLE
ncbi:inverse autotransporter beta domain-containing protein [Alienimonas californiensis]|uniref:inverse autotransporter beta domain-containing protein n=1 Tax=Alienimonas californiensis TaxID=2527989 RepID=UPI0011A1E016|nr:inverse autotransporter beta domain-containing protein [Alienimonas californiensis]